MSGPASAPVVAALLIWASGAVLLLVHWLLGWWRSPGPVPRLGLGLGGCRVAWVLSGGLASHGAVGVLGRPMLGSKDDARGRTLRFQMLGFL